MNFWGQLPHGKEVPNSSELPVSSACPAIKSHKPFLSRLISSPWSLSLYISFLTLFSVSRLLWKSQDLLSPSWGKHHGLLPLPTQFTPSVCWEMHWKMEVESGPSQSHLYGREIRGVLSYSAFFFSFLFPPLLPSPAAEGVL